MATPPWSTAEAAAFEVERARLLSVADPATRREFYRMLAVREGARAAAARHGATGIRSTTPHTSRPATGPAAGARRFTTAQSKRRLFDDARWAANNMVRRRGAHTCAMAFAGWRAYAATTPRTGPSSSTTTSSAAPAPAPAAPPPAAPAPPPPLAEEPPPLQQRPPAPAPAPPTTMEQAPAQPGIDADETSAAPAPAPPPAAEQPPPLPIDADVPMRPSAVTGARAKMRTPPRRTKAPPSPSAEPVDVASTLPPDTPSTATPKAKRRLEPLLEGVAPAAAAAAHRPTTSPGTAPPHPAPQPPVVATAPPTGSPATESKVHASTLPRADTAPPTNSTTEAAAYGHHEAWLRAFALQPTERRCRGSRERPAPPPVTPHRSTADRQQDRRRSPRGSPHGESTGDSPPPHA